MIYVVTGVRDGSSGVILVTINLEIAKSELLADGWAIEEWENDKKVGEITYDEEAGFFRCN